MSEVIAIIALNFSENILSKRFVILHILICLNAKVEKKTEKA